MQERFHVRSWLYRVLLLPVECNQLLWGVTADPESEPQENPVAWTKSPNGARVFLTTLGHPEDFGVASFRNMPTNGIRWTVGDL